MNPKEKNFNLEEAKKAQRESRDTAPLFKLSVGWGGW